MFDIGFSEILLIFGLTLVVLGPDKLPQVARTIGRWAGRARAMARQFRDQLEAETDNFKVDLKPPPPPPQPNTAPPPPAAAAPAPAPAPATTTTPTTTSQPTPDTAAHDRRE